MKFEDYVYYDETSPSGLRWKVDGLFGEYYKTPVYFADSVAGSLNKSNGYWNVKICGKTFKAHRVICQILYPDECGGEWMCDHIDGNTKNNNKNNLRVVDIKINSRNKRMMKNNTSGVTGVMFREDHNGKYKYWAGYFQNESGKRIEKKFSISKFGNEKAFELATHWRELRLQEMINEERYTYRHGK